MTKASAPDNGITDEMLVAFADGEADDATAERIEAALETDEKLADRLEMFVATRRILKRQFDPIAREPVPDHLTKFVMSGGRPADAPSNVLPMVPKQKVAPVRNANSWFSLPIAASIAGIAAGVLGYFIGTGTVRGPTEGPMLALAAADAPLGKLLTSGADGNRAPWADQASGRRGEIILRASHKTRAGYCRTYGVTESTGQAFGAVACRLGETWKTEIVTAEGESIGGYAPATGMAKAVDAFLDAAEAEEPLSSTAVRERIARGWK